MVPEILRLYREDVSVSYKGERIQAWSNLWGSIELRMHCWNGQSPCLTRPVRLGLALTEDATELIVLMEEALGLRFSPDGVAAVFRTVVFALAGVVEGKPMRVTLCTGANNPYLGWH